jgi:hypothetical protein
MGGLFLEYCSLLSFFLEQLQPSGTRSIEHPLENFFGFVRWDVNNINTVNGMIGTIAHTDIVQEADRALEVEDGPSLPLLSTRVKRDPVNHHMNFFDITFLY